MATGTSCLGYEIVIKEENRGQAIIDSHAEVLARRCFQRWNFAHLALLPTLTLMFSSTSQVSNDGNGSIDYKSSRVYFFSSVCSLCVRDRMMQASEGSRYGGGLYCFSSEFGTVGSSSNATAAAAAGTTAAITAATTEDDNHGRLSFSIGKTPPMSDNDGDSAVMRKLGYYHG